MLKKFTSNAIQFAKKMSNAASSGTKSSGSILNISDAMKKIDVLPAHISSGVTDVFSEITDYLKVAEIESTKRTEIIAKRDVALKTLQNQKEAFEQMMLHTFKERATVIQMQFEVLNTAMANGDVSTVKHALDGMVAVIQTSPFRSGQEMQAALGSKDFVVRLE